MEKEKFILHIYATKEERQEIDSFISGFQVLPGISMRAGDSIAQILLALSRDRKLIESIKDTIKGE